MNNFWPFFIVHIQDCNISTSDPKSVSMLYHKIIKFSVEGNLLAIFDYAIITFPLVLYFL